MYLTKTDIWTEYRICTMQAQCPVVGTRSKGNGKVTVGAGNANAHTVTTSLQARRLVHIPDESGQDRADITKGQA